MKSDFPITILLAIGFTILFTSCREKQVTRETLTKKEAPVTRTEPEPIVKTIKLETFKTIPPDVEGCQCNFSKDSLSLQKQEYLYVDDYDTFSYMKLNGKMVKLMHQDKQKPKEGIEVFKASNDSLQATITINEGETTGDETWLSRGTISIKHKDGEATTVPFIGVCGC